MFGRYEGIKISGIESVVPKMIFDNYDYIEGIEDRKTKKQVKLTGIRQRHVLEEKQTISQLATVAANNIINNLLWDRNDIRVLVFVTQTPELSAPSTAMIIQKELKIGTDCFAFDVNLGCAGYISGLEIVGSLIKNTGGKGLLITGDAIWDIPKDKEVGKDALLFGCGVTATAIEIDKASEGIRYSQFTDGSRYDLLYITKGGKTVMDGNAVLLFSMNDVCDAIKETMSKFEIEDSDIDYYVFHQSQKMSVEGIAYECKIPMDKVLISYEEYGNTSSSSIPISICSNISEFSRKKSITLFLCGFGIGLSWNTAIIKISSDAVFPIESI